MRSVAEIGCKQCYVGWITLSMVIFEQGTEVVRALKGHP